MGGPWAQAENLTITIPNNETESDSFVVFDFCRGGYQLPAAVTGETIGIEVSLDGERWAALRDAEGTAATPANAAANAVYPLPPQVFSARYARFKSASSEGAAREILVFLAGPAAS